MTESIRVEKEGEVTRLIMNRPAYYNAFDFDMIDGFASVLVELAADKSVRSIILSGEGKAFCAGGGTFTLPRIVGLARALEIVAFDTPISSAQALSWGLVNRVVDDGKSLAEASALAHTLADKSLISYGCVKQLLNDSFSNSFETHIEQERMMLCACADGPDAKEGLKAFVEKRKPVYNIKDDGR